MRHPCFIFFFSLNVQTQANNRKILNPFLMIGRFGFLTCAGTEAHVGRDDLNSCPELFVQSVYII